MSGRMTQALVIQALKRAFQTQTLTKGLIHHSDGGSQYAALDYQALLRSKGIIMSILEYIVSFYNYESIHSYLDYLSPMAFEKQYA